MKITDHDHDKYITNPEFIKIIAENFTTRLAQRLLPRKNGITGLVKKTDFDEELKKVRIT